MRLLATVSALVVVALVAAFLVPGEAIAIDPERCERNCDTRLNLDLYNCDTEYFFCLSGCPIPSPICVSSCNAALSQCQFWAIVNYDVCLGFCNNGPNPGCM